MQSASLACNYGAISGYFVCARLAGRSEALCLSAAIVFRSGSQEVQTHLCYCLQREDALSQRV